MCQRRWYQGTNSKQGIDIYIRLLEATFGCKFYIFSFLFFWQLWAKWNDITTKVFISLRFDTAELSTWLHKIRNLQYTYPSCRSGTAGGPECHPEWPPPAGSSTVTEEGSVRPRAPPTAVLPPLPDVLQPRRTRGQCVFLCPSCANIRPLGLKT